MTGNELYEHLAALAYLVRPEVATLAREKRWGEWWTLSGYLEVLEDGMRRIRNHGNRAVKAYQSDPKIVAIVGKNDAL